MGGHHRACLVLLAISAVPKLSSTQILGVENVRGIYGVMTSAIAAKAVLPRNLSVVMREAVAA